MSDGGTREFGVATQIKKLHIRSPKLPPIVDFAISMYLPFVQPTKQLTTHIRSNKAKPMGRCDFMS